MIMKVVIRFILSFAIVANLHALLFMGMLFSNFAERSSVAAAFELIARCAFPAEAISGIHSSLGGSVAFVIVMLSLHVLWAAIIAAYWTHLKNRTSQNIMLEGSAESSASIAPSA